MRHDPARNSSAELLSCSSEQEPRGISPHLLQEGGALPVMSSLCARLLSRRVLSLGSVFLILDSTEKGMEESRSVASESGADPVRSFERWKNRYAKRKDKLRQRRKQKKPEWEVERESIAALERRFSEVRINAYSGWQRLLCPWIAFVSQNDFRNKEVIN